MRWINVEVEDIEMEDAIDEDKNLENNEDVQVISDEVDDLDITENNENK